MSGSSRGKEMRRAIARELARLNIKAEFAHTGSGHQAVQFGVAGRRCQYIFSATPSDWRAGRRVVADIRRMARGARP